MIKLGYIEKLAADNLSLSLARLAKDFRDMNENDLANTAILAIAAMSGIEDPHSDITLSYVMRQINKVDKDKSIQFFKQFKESADSAYIQGMDPQNIESVCLMEALQKLDISPEEFDDA